ncbi:unnamed protein product [Caenorhabditis brenneri]
MAVAPSFPLYDLPKDELCSVIRVMDPVALFKLSLLSRRSKNLVKSRKWNAFGLYIYVHSWSIDIRCNFSQFLGVSCTFHTDNSVPKEIVNPSDIMFRCNMDLSYNWRKKGFEARDWLDHFKTTFHLKKFDILFLDYAALFNIDSLYKQFGTPNFLSIRKSFSHDTDNQILKVLAPKNRLYVTTSIFESWHNRNTILIQTLDELGMYGPDSSFTLDHLLCINARKIVCSVSEVSLKVVNKFLKLWKSGSNSRLEQLYIKLQSYVPGSDIIMKGIAYQIVPREQNEQRRFKS